PRPRRARRAHAGRRRPRGTRLASQSPERPRRPTRESRRPFSSRSCASRRSATAPAASCAAAAPTPGSAPAAPGPLRMSEGEGRVCVGGGAGGDEDREGIPFVGRAGQLLNQIIKAMGFARQEVYIANVVKCRPPDNRTPQPDEVAACTPFLFRQIETIRPAV